MKTDLIQSALRAAVHYDPDTGHFTRLVRTSNRINAGDLAGSLTALGYLRFFVCGRSYAAHRLAWLYMTGTWPHGEVDHINGDKVDNRFANLRVVSRSVNMQNQRRARVENKVGALGVSVQKGRFRAQIQTPAGKVHIGMYGTQEEAHAAYVAAKRKLHEGCTL